MNKGGTVRFRPVLCLTATLSALQIVHHHICGPLGRIRASAAHLVEGSELVGGLFGAAFGIIEQIYTALAIKGPVQRSCKNSGAT